MVLINQNKIYVVLYSCCVMSCFNRVALVFCCVVLVLCCVIFVLSGVALVLSGVALVLRCVVTRVVF